MNENALWAVGFICLAAVFIFSPESCNGKNLTTIQEENRHKEEMARITTFPADSLIVIKGDTFKLCKQLLK
jgi:hypothetical protein